MNHEDIKSLLEKDARWTDAAGNSLLHYAARLGDKETAELCLRRGVKTLVYNDDGYCARDVARAWGHDALALQLDVEMKLERAVTAAPPLGYASLQEIRDKSAATGRNIFYFLAAHGRFDQVVALAGKNSDALSAQDFLGQGADGEKVILRICQCGQLPELMKPELWTRNLADFLSVWENVPKIYQKDLDVGGLISRIRQLKLQSRASKPQWKG